MKNLLLPRADSRRSDAALAKNIEGCPRQCINPDELDDYLQGKSPLSRLYRREDSPEPPHALDRRVLDSAREAQATHGTQATPCKTAISGAAGVRRQSSFIGGAGARHGVRPPKKAAAPKSRRVWCVQPFARTSHTLARRRNGWRTSPPCVDPDTARRPTPNSGAFAASIRTIPPCIPRVQPKGFGTALKLKP